MQQSRLQQRLLGISLGGIQNQSKHIWCFPSCSSTGCSAQYLGSLSSFFSPAFPGGLAWHSDVKHLWDGVPPLSFWLCSLKTRCGPPSFSRCYKQQMRAFLPCCLGAIPHCSGPFSKPEDPHLLSSSSKGTILCFFWLLFTSSVQ